MPAQFTNWQIRFKSDRQSKGVFWCRDSDAASGAARIMENKRVRRLPVIDANKRMVGMLSLGDISHAASQRTTAGNREGLLGSSPLNQTGRAVIILTIQFQGDRT
jgi:CBS-domain-containing membrane protein